MILCTWTPLLYPVMRADWPCLPHAVAVAAVAVAVAADHLVQTSGRCRLVACPQNPADPPATALQQALVARSSAACRLGPSDPAGRMPACTQEDWIGLLSSATVSKRTDAEVWHVLWSTGCVLSLHCECNAASEGLAPDEMSVAVPCRSELSYHSQIRAKDVGGDLSKDENFPE